jgi:hypothetical protein
VVEIAPDVLPHVQARGVEGASLDSLRDLRNQADHDLAWSLSRRKADEHVETARGIIETLEAVEADAAFQAAITQTMRDYERDVLKDVTWKE